MSYSGLGIIGGGRMVIPQGSIVSATGLMSEGAVSRDPDPAVRAAAVDRLVAALPAAMASTGVMAFVGARKEGSPGVGRRKIVVRGRLLQDVTEAQLREAFNLTYGQATRAVGGTAGWRLDIEHPGFVRRAQAGPSDEGFQYELDTSTSRAEVPGWAIGLAIVGGLAVVGVVIVAATGKKRRGTVSGTAPTMAANRRRRRR